MYTSIRKALPVKKQMPAIFLTLLVFVFLAGIGATMAAGQIFDGSAKQLFTVGGMAFKASDKQLVTVCGMVVSLVTSIILMKQQRG
jgi:hypothetical protein